MNTIYYIECENCGNKDNPRLPGGDCLGCGDQRKLKEEFKNNVDHTGGGYKYIDLSKEMTTGGEGTMFLVPPVDEHGETINPGNFMFRGD